MYNGTGKCVGPADGAVRAGAAERGGASVHLQLPGPAGRRRDRAGRGPGRRLPGADRAGDGRMMGYKKSRTARSNRPGQLTKRFVNHENICIIPREHVFDKGGLG